MSKNAENLKIIRRILDEHRKIKEHLRLAGDSLSDKEVVGGLERTETALATGVLDNLPLTQEALRRSFRVLDEGLRNHFALEESSLVSLLGGPLMQGLELEHREVRKSMEATRLIINTELRGMSRKELVEAAGHMYHALTALKKTVEGHAAREEVILNMLERVLK